MNAPLAPLGRNRPLLVYLASQGLSALGEAISLVAVPLLVLAATGSVAQMGVVTALAMGVQVVGTFAFGAFIDRLDRRHVMLVSELLRALLLAAVPLTWIALGPNLTVLYLVVAGGALAASAFQVASAAVIPSLVDKEQLTQANSRLHATFAAGLIGGPALAGVLASLGGPSLAVGVDAALVFSAVVIFRFVPFRPTPPTATTSTKITFGLSFIAGHRTLRFLVALVASERFITLAVIDLFVFKLSREMGLSELDVGACFGLASLGSIAGALLTPSIRHRLGFRKAYMFAGAVLTGALIAACSAKGFASAATAAAAFMFASAMRSVLAMTLRHESIPRELLGRITATFWVLSEAPAPLGAAAAGLLADRSGTRATFGVASVIALVITLSTLLLRLPPPASQPSETT